MQIAVLTRVMPGCDPSAYSQLLSEEHDVGRRLGEAGLIVQAHLRADIAGALLILEAADAPEARARVGELPLVRDGFFEVEQLVPLAAPDPR